MFWNVTFIYNAFIRTTDHCKVQTAFVSLFYIFINMKPWNASNSSVVVWRPCPLGHLTNFCTNFFNFEKFVKIREFFFAEVTNSRSMIGIALGHNFVSGLRALKPKKNLKLFLKSSVFPALAKPPALTRMERRLFVK